MATIKAVNPTVSGNYKSGESYRQVETIKGCTKCAVLFVGETNETGKIEIIYDGYEICAGST